MIGACVVDLECGAVRCECDCHRNPDVRHVMACCRTCPKCDQRVKFVCEAADPRYPRPSEEPA